ncbi:MAG: imidazoleglycerol-phosphate dehydratase HisB [Deltaproteobacteria bacterium]|nr:imidazoleglycerol-phosphate dehydratase HisB [Deltaproteobacteria bacterium]MCL5879861.1 imidazoleglycerol-phosphate dehydratase HisB [Deltaproteobacteria bacterium]MDA8303856.1 imidazoleglycerol-phosphate dehydratase HisB [Deltaproteobacteria bacterium]
MGNPKTENKNAKVKKGGPKERKGDFTRKTTETDIKLSLNLDGKGKYVIKTGVPFFNHMLEQFSKHSRFDMTLKAKGDIEVDLHHLIEDTGIVIGSALKELAGDKKGIRRFGSAFVPMDEALVHSVADFSGRAFFVYKDTSDVPGSFHLIKSFEGLKGKYSNFDEEGAREVLVDKFFYTYSNIFFEALCKNALINLHINVAYGNNTHHMVEAIFKSTGIAISDALKVVGNYGIPSTKGSI